MKHFKTALLLSLVSLFFTACKNKNKEQVPDLKDSSTMVSPKTDSVKFTVAIVDNAKDPTCGMPVSAGIEDTAHYNNKVLGFCSKECKDEFLKNAVKNITSVEWKK